MRQRGTGRLFRMTDIAEKILVSGIVRLCGKALRRTELKKLMGPEGENGRQRWLKLQDFICGYVLPASSCLCVGLTHVPNVVPHISPTYAESNYFLFIRGQNRINNVYVIV